jgi:hypothetical protein
MDEEEEEEEREQGQRKAHQYNEEESVQSGRYGPQYSDSDGELPEDDEDEGNMRPKHAAAPHMWDSWGVLKNYAAAPLKTEDIELNSLHSFDHSPGALDTESPAAPLSQPRSRMDSFDIVDHRKFLSTEEEVDGEVEEDDASLRTYETDTSRPQKLIQVAQGPVDEDMTRAWETHLEDIHDNELETLAGWYGDAPKVCSLIPHLLPRLLSTGDRSPHPDPYAGRSRHHRR